MINEIEVNTLKAFAEFVAEKASEDKPYWFRGVRSAAAHKLLPSLYRHPTAARTVEATRDLEDELMSSFAHRALPFQSPIPEKPMELLFLMQHFGIPTRLLDWSENPFVSLFFALENALWEEDAHAVDSAVWMIEPLALNRISLRNHAGVSQILSANDDLLNAYEPAGPRKNSGLSPVAMFGVHNSRRIVAQRGVFILFGGSLEPMDSDAALVGADILHKLIVKKEFKKPMAKALFNMGVTDSVIYPDLDGLGREINEVVPENRTGV